MSERRAGIYAADIFSGGSTTPLVDLKPKGAFDPLDDALILPDVKDPKMWYEGRLPFVDNDHTIFMFAFFSYTALGINTNLVKAEEIKSYNDLLDPKWRGKMVILDPTQPGTGNRFTSIMGDVYMGWDYVRKLVENKPIILRDERQRLEWLAQGKVSIALSPNSVQLTAFRKIGAPVAVVIPKEGGWVSGGTSAFSLLNRAAHPNAARVFLNWLFTQEGQTVTSKVSGMQSARVDVPTDFLEPMLVRDPSKKYFMAETEEFIRRTEENQKVAREIFKDVLN